jgi:hypothetical protein
MGNTFFWQGLAITSSIILRGTVDELEIPSTQAPERVESIVYSRRKIERGEMQNYGEIGRDRS